MARRYSLGVNAFNFIWFNFTFMNQAQLPKERERFVKEKLWRSGHQATDVSQFSSFDILVDRKLRLEVKYANPRAQLRGRWMLYAVSPSEFDILAVVFTAPLGFTVYFLKSKLFLKKMVNHENYYHHNIGITEETLKRCFTKNFSKIQIIKRKNTPLGI